MKVCKYISINNIFTSFYLVFSKQNDEKLIYCNTYYRKQYVLY